MVLIALRRSDEKNVSAVDVYDVRLSQIMKILIYNNARFHYVNFQKTKRKL